MNFVAGCVRQGRIFVSRLMQWLKTLYRLDDKKHTIPYSVKKDLQWLNKFLTRYNGISMLMTEEWSEPDDIFSSDSCLTACGGFWQGKCFHVKFPNNILSQKFHINILEMLAIIICLRLWGIFFKGK